MIKQAAAVVIAGILLALVAQYLTRDYAIFDNVEFEDWPEGYVEDLEKIPSELRMSEIPWIVWDVGSKLGGQNVRETTCSKGACIVKPQQGNESPVYHNSQTRAIMMYGSQFDAHPAPLPRLKHHLWALLHEESPKNNAMYSHDDVIELFNITSTFRQGSDLPVTLQFLPSRGYLLRDPVPVEEKNKYRRGEEKLAPVVYVQSVCHNPSYRDVYIAKIMEHVKVDALGKCLNNREMPEMYTPTTEMFNQGFYDIIRKYKFILAFENAICPDYITEKLWRPLHLGIVPIYRGAPNVHEWLPSNKSALVYEDFASPHALAEFIKYLDGNDTAYNEYLEFKMGGDHFTNDKLQNRLRDRPYSGANFEENQTLYHEESGKPDFIGTFECLVCDRVHDQLTLEREHQEQGLPPPPPRIANSSHYGCPAPAALPEESLWLYSPTQQSEYMIDWLGDYESARHTAAMVKRMVEVGKPIKWPRDASTEVPSDEVVADKPEHTAA